MRNECPSSRATSSLQLGKPPLSSPRRIAHAAPIIYTDDFPPAPYIENIGVRPNITLDYMTRQNLLTGGSAFVAAFTQAVVQHAQSTP